MWKEEQIAHYIKERLSEKRFRHVIGVRDTAAKLADIHGEDREKAVTAALIHDCAKNIKDEELINIVKENGYNFDWIEEASPQLLHGRAAGYIAKNVMGLEDESIFNAVTYHTTGRSSMTLLEKIIYVADYIEPTRDFPGVEELRNMTSSDIDKGVLAALENTIKYVINKGQLLHNNTIEARNHLLMELRGRKLE
jgi:conserved hypothetical protein TIGR00488